MLLERINRITRRALTGHPSSVTAESHSAWVQEQIRAYATMQPFVGPLNSIDNITAETHEMREAYRLAAMKEPAAFAAIHTKTFDVCRLDPQVHPEDKDDPTHQKAAEYVDTAIKRAAGGWPQLLYNVALSAQMDGFSLTEKVIDTYDRDHPRYPGRWTLKAAKAKDTKYIRLKLDPYKNVVGIQAMAAGQGGVTLDPGDYILYTYMKLFESPFGLSAFRPVHRAVTLIVAAIKLRAILLENFSGPYLIGTAKDAAARLQVGGVLAEARARGWIVIPEGSEVQVENLATSAPDQFQQTIEDLRKEIFLGISGAYLQALESDSPQGDSDTHEGQTTPFKWWLSVSLTSCLTDQLVPDLVVPNFGVAGGRPIITLGGVDTAAVLKELDKLKKVKDDLKTPISKRQVYEISGAEPPRDEADAIKAEPPQQPPGGAGNPFMFAQAHQFADNSRFAVGPGELRGDLHDLLGMEAQSFADRSGLVRKKITRNDGVETWVWVNPNKGDHAGRDGTPTVDQHHERQTRAETAVASAVGDPSRLHTGHLDELAGHLDHLSRDRLKDLARQLEQRVGGKKAELADRIVAAVRAQHAGQPLPGRRGPGTPPTDKRPDGTPAAPKVEDVHTVPTKSLHTDPERFQYKVSGIGAGGVGQELKGTQTWNPELGGVILAWRDPENGKDYVVNGHHRHELADRVDQPTMNVRYIQASDAKTARAKGALANIAEGRGTAVDAAKYLRDTGSSDADLRAAGISLSGKVAADALTLKDLGDKPFQALTEGRLEEGPALAVARHLKDPTLQDALFKKLADREEAGKEWSPREIETAARKMAAAGTVKDSGVDLFGTWEEDKSTFDQEVELESHVGRLLAQRANDFAAVANAKRADRVAGAGNVLVVDENQKRRVQAEQELETFNRLVNRSGPIAEAVKASAAELAVAKTKKEKDGAKQRAFDRVQQAVGTELARYGPKPVEAVPGTTGGSQP